MLLPNAQDILAEEKPRLICGLGLPGIRFTVITIISYIYIYIYIYIYQMFHCLGNSLNFYHFYFPFIGIYHT
jgi:hypothetical protein